MNKKQASVLNFIYAIDDLALIINQKANELFALLNNFDASQFDIDDEFKYYFINHHLGPRLFFSMQNSAHILHQSISKTGKAVNEINIVDYGAGLGTLYMLAGMMNFKRIVYNDYLPNWKDTAESICKSLKIPITAYITGDIEDVLKYADDAGFKYDIVASRNVIEHIYSLPNFYTLLYKHNPKAVIFSTTTANYHNPAMRFKHYLLHKKVENNIYKDQRKKAIEKEWPSVSPVQLNDLIIKTRGKGQNDFIKAIQQYKKNEPVEPVEFLRTNTCDCYSGSWHEHLLTRDEYRQIITGSGYKFEYTAGYWDTHYKSPVMNILGKTLNKIIGVWGTKAFPLSPFVNVVAYS
jgi:2-polyprenyl-3-methyl-5-hydroxy-6-metoxy-1,4-benzoquinol methylase